MTSDVSLNLKKSLSPGDISSKPRIDIENNDRCGLFSTLPREVFVKIFNDISYQDLIAVEITCRSIKFINEDVWKLKNENNPDWEECSKDEIKQKWKFCLTRAFRRFICKQYTDWKVPKDFNTAAEIEKIFGGLADKFPRFGAVIEREALNYQRSMPIGNMLVGLDRKILDGLNDKINEIYKQARKKEWGGEHLLYTYIEIRNALYNEVSDLDFINPIITTGIEKKAFDISLVAVTCLYKDDPQIKKLLLSLALKSAENSCYEGLEVYLKRGSPIEVEDLFKQGHIFPPILIRKADNLVAASKRQEAEPLYELALAQYGQEVPAWLLFKAAYNLCMQKRYAEAEPLYARAIEKAPQNAEYLNNAAVNLRQQKKYTEAEPLYARAMEIDPQNAVYLNNAAANLYYQKRYAEAEPLYARAIKEAPQNAVYLNNAAGNLYYQMRYAEAEPLYARAIKEAPQNAQFLNNAAYNLYKQKRYAEAKPLYARAIEQAPQDAEYLNNAAHNLYKQKRYAKAEPLFARAIKKAPQNAEYLHNAANNLSSQMIYAEAEPLYARAIEIDPQNAVYLNDAANNLYYQKKYAEAEPLYANAMEINPQKALYLNNAADNLYKQKRYTEAELLYAKAIEKYGRRVPAFCLYDASANKFALKNYAEAKNLAEQAKEKFGKEIPPDLTSLLKKIDEVMHLQTPST